MTKVTKHYTGTVLVVDDEPSVRQLTGRMLEELGFTVLSAVDGQEAVDLFRADADNIALVVSDVMMPRLNGRDAFMEIRRLRPDARVILTSGDCEQEVFASLEGLAGFLAKPFHMSDLREALRLAMERSPEVFEVSRTVDDAHDFQRISSRSVEN